MPDAPKPPALADDYATVLALRKTLCRRLHEHQYETARCDGVGVVCGFCDHTARQQCAALRAAVGGGGK